jgi:ribosome-binding factor A
MSRRTDRVNELLREELGELIQLRIRDPRVEGRMISITEVEVSPDLRHATVFVSCLEFSETPEAVDGLQHSAAFLHQELAHRLHLRAIPRLTFRVDPSLERGARLASLIKQVADSPPQP